jgi:hypothetical protein
LCYHVQKLAQLIELELAQALELALEQALELALLCWLNAQLNKVVVYQHSPHHLMRTSRKRLKKRLRLIILRLLQIFSLGNPLENWKFKLVSI